MPIQDFGPQFSIDKLLGARQRARDLCFELSGLITAGMTEEDAHRLYKELSIKHGVQRQWHPAKLRFGPNTVKSFREVSEPYELKSEDIFFLDIGPVFEGHEADYGETFVIGNQYEHKLIAQSSKKIFEAVARHWQETKTSGPELYEYAKALSSKAGFNLSMLSDGHRIGDFPHHVHFKGGLSECEEIVIPNAWILEIHLNLNGVGAFYEDILTELKNQ